MDNKELKEAISKIEKEIKKSANKLFKVLFYVIDTKGNPSGSLSYIYEVAYQLKELGYNVQMVHNEKDFFGVKDWLGKKYADLPHYDIEKSNIDISPADFLFIPEIFSNVMYKTKELPCKRIVILQNFKFLTEIIPYGTSWRDYGIHECITTTSSLSDRIKEVFPNTLTRIVRPSIKKMFSKSNKTKKLTINIVAKNQSDINSIVKPFMWKYPMYKWVSFNDLRGMTQEDFAEQLKESFATIWIDTDTDFGYSALEAMACENLVIAKVPENGCEWGLDSNSELKDNVLWFYRNYDALSIITTLVQAYLDEAIPESVYEEMNETVSYYSEENQLEDIKSVIVDGIFAQRQKELEITLNVLNNKLENKETEA